ncbi:MAG TPA: L,D-transpeptidase [Polyangiaceae bacterium]|nr:L,D-transpeptidase [Polyangiaceae bacterium]
MDFLTESRSPAFPGLASARRKSFFGLLGLGHLLLLGLTGCDQDSEERSLPPVNSAPTSAAQSGRPTLPAELHPKPPSSAAEMPVAPKAPPPHPGPWFVVTSSSTGLYEKASFDKTGKFGYARNGERLPVSGPSGSKDNCSGGWYALVGGGFVCGNSGTIDEKSADLKFVQKPPNLADILPYRYARNAKNGTPLYRSIPTREQMHTYEPYLESEQKEKAEAEKVAENPAPRPPRASAENKPAAIDVKTAATEAPGPAAVRVSEQHGLGAGNGDAAEAAAEPPVAVPWWQAEDAKDRLHEVTLEKLQSDADDVLAKRMVSGFYVAIDKTFSWHGRTWYKTTKGLVTPADRFWQTKGSDFKGVELGTEYRLPMAWVIGVQKSTSAYRIDEATDGIEPERTLDRFQAVALSGETKNHRGVAYHQTRDGLWVKSRFLRVTEPGDIPSELQPGERWIDVNLTQQTIVAFEGETPRYATLISSGKKSSMKEKDHRTPTGTWRIYVKHLTDTMDGDGTAAGDLPYSIEDVPYVMYFHESYALHGAFWHANYGVQMSHGCVNLAPLDAKYLFFFATPELVPGSHGAWSSPQRRGSLVQIHE